MQGITSAGRATCLSRPSTQPAPAPARISPAVQAINSHDVISRLPPALAAATILLATPALSARAANMALPMPQASTSQTTAVHRTTAAAPLSARLSPAPSLPFSTPPLTLAEAPSQAPSPRLTAGLPILHHHTEQQPAAADQPEDAGPPGLGSPAAVGGGPAAAVTEPPLEAPRGPAGLVRPSGQPSACSIARLRRSPAPFMAHLSGRMSFALCGMRAGGGPAPPGA